MSATDSLHSLIKSLNKSEKRYFKVQNNYIVNKDSNYMRLFDALDKQEEYDDEKLTDKFRGETILKHLPSEKNYLFELILKTLRQYNAEKSISFILQDLLKDIDILFGMGMRKECAKRIKKGKKLAYQYEEYETLLELLNWERTLLKYQYSNQIAEAIQMFNIERDQVRNLVENRLNYRKVYDAFFVVLKRDYLKKTKSQLEEAEEIIKDPLLRDKNNALTTRSLLLFHVCHAYYYLLHDDKESSFRMFKEMADLLEAKPHLIKDNPSDYFVAINSLSIGMYSQSQIPLLEEYTRKLRKLKTKSVKEEADSFQNIYLMEQYVYVAFGQIDKALNLVQPIQNGLQQYGDLVSKSKQVTFSYNIALTYFEDEQFEKAGEWLEKIIESKLDTRRDLYYMSHVLRLIVHLETSEKSVVKYYRDIAFRAFNNTEHKTPFEKTILWYVNKLNKALDKNDFAEVLTKFQTDLLDLQQKKEDVSDMPVLLYWTQSRLEKRPMREIIAEHMEATKEKATA